MMQLYTTLFIRNKIPQIDEPTVNEGKHVILPILYAATKTGNVKYYEVEVNHEKTYSEIICRKASKIGGKIQQDIYLICTGVNIGKANETTIREQAFLQANSTFRKLQDQGYKTAEQLSVDVNAENLSELLTKVLIEDNSGVNTDASGNYKPMLAKDFNPKILELPCIAQPKYNGARCLAVKKGGKVTLTSRNGKPYFIERVQKKLATLMAEGEIFDGELYMHGVKLQTIISAVRTQNTKHELQDSIQYVVYDIPSNKIWTNRYVDLLNKPLPTFGISRDDIVTRSPGEIVNSEAMIKKVHDKFIKQGFEGAILRMEKGTYEFGFRSKYLMKYKEMMDAEFTIVGFKEATGRNAGTIVFRCQIPEKIGGRNGDGTFDVVPEGTLEVKAGYWKKRKTFLGKPLTVQFQEYSADMIPIFPVGIVVRDYE